MFAGGVQDTESCLSPGVTLTFVGGNGADVGIVPLAADEAAPGPNAVVAIAVKLYVVPPTNPNTVQEVEAVVHDAPPGLALTV